MDVLKKSLLIAFYLVIIAVGIAGFFLLSSVRERPAPPVQEQIEENPNITQMEKAK
jgi:hypothetical protein